MSTKKQELFLKVYKDYFVLDLTPIELLVLSQIKEFQTNSKICYMTDQQFADCFNVSGSTISRAIKKLVDGGFIKRETQTTQNGKLRHLFVNLENIEEKIKNSKKANSADDDKNIDDDKNANSATVKMTLAQESKLPLRNSQNDIIKDNIKDKGKDNSNTNNTTNSNKPVGEITLEQLASMGCRYEEIGENLIKIVDTQKVLKVKEKENKQNEQ